MLRSGEGALKQVVWGMLQRVPGEVARGGSRLGASGGAGPPAQTVVRRHGDVFPQGEAVGTCSSVDILGVPEAHLRVAAPQGEIEGGVGRLERAVTVTEGSIDDQRCPVGQESRCMAEERGGRLGGGDVQHVRAEDRVGRGHRGVGSEEVEGEGRAQVGQVGLPSPRFDAVEVSGAIHRLPGHR